MWMVSLSDVTPVWAGESWGGEEWLGVGEREGGHGESSRAGCGEGGESVGRGVRPEVGRGSERV